MYPAYIMEIVVSTGQMREAAQILAAIAGHEDVHVARPRTSGWSRPILTTDTEQHPHELGS